MDDSATAAIYWGDEGIFCKELSGEIFVLYVRKNGTFV
jgi:hypothetical protein